MGTKIERIQPLLGDWKIKRELGKGSFGEVYEIEKTEFGATFSAALKVISIPQSEDDYKEALSEGMTSDSANKYFRSMVEEMTKEFTLMDKVKGNTNIVDYADHKVIEHKDGCGWEDLRDHAFVFFRLFFGTHDHELFNLVKSVVGPRYHR